MQEDEIADPILPVESIMSVLATAEVYSGTFGTRIIYGFRSNGEDDCGWGAVAFPSYTYIFHHMEIMIRGIDKTQR